jgi:hypothetical protein
VKPIADIATRRASPNSCATRNIVGIFATVRHSTLDQERGGPIRAEDFEAKGKPAIFRGQIVGDTLKLAVSTSGALEPQNDVLYQGHSKKLARCL